MNAYALIAICWSVGSAVLLAYLLVQDIRGPGAERPFLPGAPFNFDFDDHADEAIALLGDDFTEWEKELSTHGS